MNTHNNLVIKKTAMELIRQNRYIELADMILTAHESATPMHSPKGIAQMLMDLIGRKRKEVFAIVLLNTAHQIINIEIVTEGTVDRTIIDPREAFRNAIIQDATSIILSHNHPGGSMKPSEEDVDVTRRLQKAGEILKINVLDHIIVSGRKYYSFVENGIL